MGSPPSDMKHIICILKALFKTIGSIGCTDIYVEDIFNKPKISKSSNLPVCLRRHY